MRKVLLGMIVGGAAVYFLDPVSGADRRARAMGGWREQKETVLEVARSTAGAVAGVGQEVGGRVAEIRGRTEPENGRAAAHASKADVSG